MSLVDSLDPDPALRICKRCPVEPGGADYILAHPGSVGLAVYQVGQEANGAYLNADVPYAIGFGCKGIDLIAYAEAVAYGELDPLSTVIIRRNPGILSAHDRFRPHADAVAGLEANGRLFGQPATILLDEVPGDDRVQ